jgi:histidine phosphotransferase ChpT
MAEIGRLTRGLIEDEKIELDWPDGGTEGGELGREATKVLLNLVLLGIEALPRGGILKIALSGPEIIVSARGVGAALRQESADAMSADVDIEALTARSVQGYFVNHLIMLLGGQTQVTADEPDMVSLTVRLAV